MGRRAAVVSLVDELIPLYPIYTLLFASAGLGDGQISILLALWSATSFVVEVPSGAWADRVSRRHLLAVAGLVRAVAFATWLLWPTFAGFATGFVLWGAAGVVISGAWEALIYDELAALGASTRYPAVIGRAEMAGAAGVIAATVAAGPLLGVGGFQAAGWVSVAVSVVGAGLVLTLPAAGPAALPDDDDAAAGRLGGRAGYVHTLRAGLRQAGREPVVRRGLLAAAVLGGVATVDEYLALLTRGLHLPPAVTPLLLVFPAVAAAAGSGLSVRAAVLSGRGLGVMVAAGGVLLALGALSRHPAGFVAIGAGYGALWCAATVAAVRLQSVITVARATVTSVCGLLTELAALALFGAAGTASSVFDLDIVLAALVVPILAIAVLLPRWLPPG